MFGGGFNATKLKPQLKMACGRIQIASNKKTALLKQSTREVAAMLAEDPPKEEKARIRAEALIRDDHLIEAYEILQLECELLHERIKLISYCRSCPPDLVSVISTIIWASHRVDIPELSLIRKQFVAKYGKAFEEQAMRNYDGILNERVVSKLSVEPPAAYLVQSYLEKICEQYDVDWTPSMKLTANDMIEPMAPPTGYSILPSATGTGFGPNTNKTIPIVVGAPTIPVTIGDNNPMIPPLAPSFSNKNTPQTSNTSESKNMNNVIPPPSTVSTIFDEPDIFVPGPSAPSSQHVPGHILKPEDDNKDDDNDVISSGYSIAPSDNDTNNNNSNIHNDDFSDSYSNLAARFNQLKK